MGQSSLKGKYKTFAEHYYLEEATFLERLKRDVRLLIFLFMNFVMWVKTRKVRAEFKRCRENNEPFYVDKFAPPGS